MYHREECVLPFAEPVADVYRQLQEMQSDMFLMSGSGSTLFILTETEQAALQLVRRLETMERTCFIASFLTDPEQDVHNRN